MECANSLANEAMAWLRKDAVTGLLSSTGKRPLSLALAAHSAVLSFLAVYSLQVNLFGLKGGSYLLGKQIWRCCHV